MKKPALLALVLAASCARSTAIPPIPQLTSAYARPAGDACTWTAQKLPGVTNGLVYSVASTHDYSSSSSSSSSYGGPSWMVGSYDAGKDLLVYRFDHRQWQLEHASGPSETLNQFYGVDALGTKDVWAVGEYVVKNVAHPLIEHWDGKGWSYVPSPSPGSFGGYLYRVNALSPTDVYAVGARFTDSNNNVAGLAERWDGKRWTVTTAQFRPNPPAQYDFATAPIYLRGTKNQIATIEADVGHFTLSYLATRTSDTAPWNLKAYSHPAYVKNLFVNGIASLGKSGELLAVGGYGTAHTTLPWAFAGLWNGKSYTWQMLPKEGIGSSLNGLAYSDAVGAIGVGSYYTAGTNQQAWAVGFNGKSWATLRSPKISFGSFSNIAPLGGTTYFWAIGNETTGNPPTAKAFAYLVKCSKF